MRLSAQVLSAARLESVAAMPLVIAQRSPAGQPIRFFAGDSGLVRALEIDAVGTTWMRGPLSIGNGVGAASHELVRIGSVAPINGDALVISMTATSTSTGVLIHDVGSTGTEDAGVVIRSVANGFGTGIRIGGPTGSNRPSLGSGIDITGGTGLRYNALTSGNGTAIEIGGTTAPRRGIDIMVSGSAHIGVLATANTNGVGIVGISQSSSYIGSPLSERIGVRGHAASNSTIAADTIVGTMGSAIRGGTGGTLTTTIGLVGRVEATGTSHAGTSIGVLGRAFSSAPGRAIAFGGCFVSDTSQLSIVALGGDVYLGSSDDARPPQITLSTAQTYDGRTRTHVFDLSATGLLRASMVAVRPSNEILLAMGNVNDLIPGGYSILRIVANVAISTLTGISGEQDGRLLVVVVIGGTLQISHDNVGSAPEHRFFLTGGNDILIDTNGTVTIWYDSTIARWRLIARS